MRHKSIPQPQLVNAAKLESGKKRGLILGTTWQKQEKEDAEAIERFLAAGGAVTQLHEGGEDYDKKLEQNTKRMPGAFNPFSKEEALTEKE